MKRMFITYTILTALISGPVGAQQQITLDSMLGQSENGNYLAQLELETAYARYWQAQEHLDLVNSYLNSEMTVKKFLHRQRERDLIRESEMHDFLATYDRARKDKKYYKHSRGQAVKRLNRLTGQQFSNITARGIELTPSRGIEHNQPAGSNFEKHEKGMAPATKEQEFKTEYKQHLRTVQFSENRTQATGEVLARHHLHGSIMKTKETELFIRNLKRYYILANRQIEAHTDAWLADIQTRKYLPAAERNIAVVPQTTAEPGLGKQLSQPVEDATRSLQGSVARTSNWKGHHSAAIQLPNGARYITADYQPGRHSEPDSEIQILRTYHSVRY